MLNWQRCRGCRSWLYIWIPPRNTKHHPSTGGRGKTPTWGEEQPWLHPKLPEGTFDLRITEVSWIFKKTTEPGHERQGGSACAGGALPGFSSFVPPGKAQILQQIELGSLPGRETEALGFGVVLAQTITKFFILKLENFCDRRKPSNGTGATIYWKLLCNINHKASTGLN